MPTPPMPNRRALVAWAAGVLASTPLRAWAQAPTEPLHAALFDIPPYASLDAQRQPTGVHVARVQALAQQAGLPLRISLWPFARVPVMLAAGQADLSLGFATPALQQSALSLGAVGWDELIVVAAPGLRLQDAAQLRRWMVGRARGACQDLANDGHLPERWFEVPAFDQGLRMLQLGRLDALCLTRSALEHAAAQARLPRSAWGDELVIRRRPIELWVRRGLPAEQQDRLQAAARRLLRGTAASAP